MMDNGGPAFPLSTIDGYATDGMTLRDWFAGQALKALVSSYDAPGRARLSEDCLAKDAYAYADAMLKARKKK